MNSLARSREFTEVITASWARCRAYGLSHSTRPSLEQLNPSESEQLREQHRFLVETTECEVLPYYENILSNSQCMILLSDPKGRILNNWGDRRFVDPDKKPFFREGTSWQEQSNGTNAIGTAIECGHPVQVQRSEHYLKANRFMIGSAAPIFDVDRNLLGVLNVSSDAYLPQAHTLGMVRLMSQSVENRLIVKSYTPNCFVLTFNTNSDNLDSQWSGLVAFSTEGVVVASNQRAERLLDRPLARRTINEIFDRTLADFKDQPDLAALELNTAAGRKLYGVIRRPQESSSVISRGAIQGDLDQAPNVSRHHIRLEDTEFGDPTMKRCIHQARRIIDKDIPLLIQGETGVGKEVFVKALHGISARRNSPVVAVNCAAIPAELVESELFGYEKGAFTGASSRGATGLIRKAHRGVLFLDEIGEMPLSAQARLLRVLQEREVTPLGSTEAYPIDIRLVSATNRSLQDRVDEGRFRQDLYYRVSGLNIRLPALRERSDRRQIVEQIHRRHRDPDQPEALSDSILDLFDHHPWPGNIRQLINVMQVALAMAGQESIDMWHLPDDFLREVQTPGQKPVTTAPQLSESPHVGFDASSALEAGGSAAANILEIYSRYSGNVSRTAKHLSCSRNTVYKHLKQLGVK
ncbi:MAG: sigma-54-dependent Fis family transcriptional regulator [Marinobacter sp.]|uniref:sigma-54-dependent Fis family transcriptional regulator n=1 Tax=Marinobacter sp. TaxID=50741 RepID=UPI0034A00A9D